MSALNREEAAKLEFLQWPNTAIGYFCGETEDPLARHMAAGLMDKKRIEELEALQTKVASKQPELELKGAA